MEPGLDEILAEALRRSADKGTWKVWQWPSTGADFYDSEAFRRYLEAELTPEELRRLLPSREGAAGSGGGNGNNGGNGNGGGAAPEAPSAGEEGEKDKAESSGDKAAASSSKPVERPAEAALRLRM